MRVAGFLFIVLHSMRAFAQAGIEPPVTKLVPTLDHLRRWCTSDSKVDACTVFVAYRLETSCSESGPSWKMHASATFRPMILLYHMHQLAHEQLHIADVTKSVTRYVGSLADPEFATAAACEQAGLEARSGFADQMREFAWESSLARDTGLPTKPLMTGTGRPARAVATSAAARASSSASGRR